MSVKENLKIVVDNINESAVKSGRKPEDIELLSVTKTVSNERILEAYEAGFKKYGENRVQELVKKIEDLPKDITWDLIGRLQKNKVKYIINKTRLVHSLCSLDLAREINRLSEKQNVITDCLVEVNIGHEDSKAGIDEKNLTEFLDQISSFEFLKIKGLMTIAPAVENPEDIRGLFAEMRNLFDKTPKTEQVEMKYLSMGMSHDYRVAIEEGSNIVRVGSAIFGERIY